MVRASIVWVVAVLVAGLAFAGLASGSADGSADGSRGLQRIPRVSYASVLKNKHAVPRQHFKLRLFTRDTRPRADLVSAGYKRVRSIAPYYGPNRAFDEWRVTRRKHDGRKLIAKLVDRLRKKGRVSFYAYLQPGNASSPFAYKCRVHGYNSLGNCRSLTTALR